jgi:hypothetical protein
MSSLNVPSFQFCEVEVFSILSAMARALARVSTLSVELVIVKGPNEELALLSLG